jgi:hypothetical protein
LIQAILLCSVYVWAVPDFPVDHYEATLDEEIYATLMPVLTPTVEICVADHLPHVVRIWAVDAAGLSTEITNPDHPRVIQSDYARQPLPWWVRADLDGDGIVGFPDFGLFSRAYARCNRELREVDCD